MPESGHQNDWISKRIEKAAESVDADIPASVTTLLEDELRGTMGERTLRPPELSTLAERIIDAMNLQDIVETDP